MREPALLPQLQQPEQSASLSQLKPTLMVVVPLRHFHLPGPHLPLHFLPVRVNSADDAGRSNAVRAVLPVTAHLP